MRLAKYLAMHTGLSRRAAEVLIDEGRVLVNGKVIMEQGTKVDPDQDSIELAGEKIRQEQRKVYYFAMNKPRGVLCTRLDTHNRKTLMEFLADEHQQVYPVGRLDGDSEGLILLTNDGDFALKATHPKFACEKVYLVQTRGHWNDADLKQLESKMHIAGENYRAIEVEKLLHTPHSSYHVMRLREGKKRQIRNICQHFNHPVISLKRIQIGPVKLSGLKPGEYRDLESEEIASFL